MKLNIVLFCLLWLHTNQSVHARIEIRDSGIKLTTEYGFGGEHHQLSPDRNTYCYLVWARREVAAVVLRT